MERTELKRSSVHDPSSLTTAATSTQCDFNSNTSASDRLLFNTNEQNEYSATQLEMFHLLQVCLYREMFKKRTFLWRRSRIYRGISDVSAYTAGANAHIQFISDLFPHMNWPEIHVNFYCLHSRRLYPICATWEEKFGIGSLELCSVNVALLCTMCQCPRALILFNPDFSLSSTTVSILLSTFSYFCFIIFFPSIFLTKGNVTFSCSESSSVTVTFLSSTGSFLMLPADYSMESLSVRLQFRTWNQEGLLFSVPFSRDPDTINLLLQLSQARLHLLLSGGPQNSDQVFSGKLYIGLNKFPCCGIHKTGIYCIMWIA